ncbi:MAG: ABC transporter ATP-binding protein [Lachnospiraceae bacterium]|nr:ABC transporter ATP-binding protein [Lachnospiraceae bacterium]
MSNAVEIEHLSKVYKLYAKPADRVKETFHVGKKENYYQEFYALNDMTVEIPKGTTLGIVGRNGSGKSTLLKILTGVLQPTSGSMRVNGTVSALLELGAGFNMEFTGRKNIYLNATILRIPKEEMDKRVDDILKFADIGDFIDQPVKTYSSGMFVRLAFAVAINVDPDILIVDEALAVGDTRFQLKCMDKFLEFQKAGKTILFVSHDVNSIKRFCERTIWINQGKLIMDGDTDSVTDQYTDFLKSELSIEEFMSNVAAKQQQQEEEHAKLTEEMLDHVDLAEVVDVRMYDSDGKEISDIEHGETVRLVIHYLVSDTSVEKPVLGVAIRSIDNKYICGINTLLDKKKIPWEKGMNTFELVYDGFNLIGGNYYFDVALMDSTATVNLDYKTRAKVFFVKMEYIAEGVVVLNHHWK